MTTPKLPPLPHWCEEGSPFAKQMQAYALAAIEALRAQIGQGVPAGWKLVPKEPTIGMLMAGRQYRVSMERPNAQHAIYAAMLASAPPAPQQIGQGESDGMPTIAEERHLRRLLAARVGMPNTYFDDGEAHGAEHSISIDFMREPVAHIDAKLRALSVTRAECVPQAESANRPSADWYKARIMETLDDDFHIGPAPLTDAREIASCGLMPLIEDYAIAVKNGDENSGMVLKKTIEASLEELESQQQKPLTDEQITAGAKALCKRSSEICGVNADDNWNLESEYFKDDARCVLEAAHTIKVNGFDVPEPLKEIADGATVWIAVCHHEKFAEWYAYRQDDAWKRRALERGLLHATKEAAVAHAKAMLGIDPNKVRVNDHVVDQLLVSVYNHQHCNKQME